METCTGAFWVCRFDLIQKKQGVRGLFLDYLKRQGLWKQENYYCAIKKKSTLSNANTAISKEKFDGLKEGADIYLGVWDGDKWKIYRLDKDRIRKGFADKEENGWDNSRLNVDEKMGESYEF